MEVVILSLPRSGSSLLAGILHDSGIPMGESFQKPDDNNPTGYFEDLRLKRSLTVHHNKKFRKYINYRNDKDNIWGMKTPEMSGRLHPVEDEFRDLRVIHLKRPILDSLKSLKKYYHNARKALSDLTERKFEDLRNLDAPVLEIEFYDLLDEPEETYREICDFLDIDPDMEALDRIDKDSVSHRVSM